MSGKIFYKFAIEAHEEGLAVGMRRFISIHETPCYCYCLAEFQHHLMNCHLSNKKPKETMLQFAKRDGRPVKRIAKSGGRFAFQTQEEALERLKYLKRKQVKHMERELAFLNRFLEVDPALSDLERKSDFYMLIPGTAELVGQYYSAWF